VEKREQAAMLLRMGCEVAQGYFFSRPVAAEQIPAMLTRALWRPRSERALHTAIAMAASTRRGHHYFIDEFLDHIGAPMGTKAKGSP
jgi:predicted signal transduction protein with EAL and GGDEF domain